MLAFVHPREKWPKRTTSQHLPYDIAPLPSSSSKILWPLTDTHSKLPYLPLFAFTSAPLPSSSVSLPLPTPPCN